MTTELEMMGLAIGLAFIQIFLYAWPGILQTGLDYALSARDEDKPLSGFAGRARRAYYNHLETLPLFIGAVLLVTLTESETGASAFGAQLYLIARVIYIPAYISGVPWVRSLVWMAAMVGLLMVLAPPFI